MAGIYLHIPFCRQACYYCDFHFSTNLNLQKSMIEAMCKEMELQSDYLGSQKLDTIYFGGGTPSLLSEVQFEFFLNKIYSSFNVSSMAEITAEANPDDLTSDKLKSLLSLGVNRLSIGVQSFHSPHLKFLNRIHSSEESIKCVEDAQHLGFKNISIDLIYGIPAANNDIWIADIKKATDLNVEHISAYCLTIEEKTVFGNWLKNGKIDKIEDEYSAQQFEILIEELERKGYEQYEVSNFAKLDLYSRHNSSYWQQIPYLGVGPGAHSFNGKFRQFNVSNNPKYIKSIGDEKVPFTEDALSKKDFVNERILISLRTKWGLDFNHLIKEFELDLLEIKGNYIEQLIDNRLATLNASSLLLTKKGLLLADHISSELFID